MNERKLTEYQKDIARNIGLTEEEYLNDLENERKSKEPFEVDIKKVAENLGMTEEEYRAELKLTEQMREYTKENKRLSLKKLLNED